jgi:hypothetical protein
VGAADRIIGIVAEGGSHKEGARKKLLGFLSSFPDALLPRRGATARCRPLEI